MSEDSLSSEALAAFLAEGFEAVSSPNGLKLVRGHCEVRVSRQAARDTLQLEIPVVRLIPERPLPPAALSYLEERNRAGKGPGRFEVEGKTVWYRATVEAGIAPESLALLALAMQETVERIGPKILNILR